MKKEINKKKIIILISVILVIIAVVIAIKIGFKKQGEKVADNNYEGTVGEFESEIDITDTENSEIREDGMKINTSSKISEEREFNGTVIDKVETFFPDIPDGETGLITATTPKDIATAYDIKIEK